MTRTPRTATGREEPEPPIHLLQDLTDGEGPQPNCGELERQREAVQTTAQCAHVCAVRRGEFELRPGGAGSLDEQAHGVVLEERLRRRESIVLRKWQGWHLHDGLATDTQGFAAGGKELQPRAYPQKCIGKHRTCIEEVLAVVEDQEQALSLDPWMIS